MKIKATQIDFRQKETSDYIRQFVKMAADNGYNTVFFYLNGRIKTPTFPYWSDSESYTPEEMRSFVAYAKECGTEIIPCVSCLGYAGDFLNRPEMEHLAELSGGLTGRFPGGALRDFCPSNEKTLEFLDAYLGEICEIFPAPYFHAGGDEWWDVGFCPRCKDSGLTPGELGFGHYEKVRRILERHGKRMMIWDDMFEYFPEELEKMDRRVVPICWHYHDEVTGWRGHFANSIEFDSCARYESLGFEYIFAPGDFSWSNFKSYVKYASKYHPLGGLYCNWEKKWGFAQRTWPMIVAGGRVFSSMDADTAEDEFVNACEYLFGTNDRHFADCLLAFYSLKYAGERKSALSSYLTHPDNGLRDQDRRLATVIARDLSSYLDMITKGREVLTDIIQSAKGLTFEYRVESLARRYFTGESGQRLEAERVSVREELEAFGRERVALWERLRPGICNRMEEIFRNYVATVDAIRELVATRGVLEVTFFLPEAFSAPFTGIKIKYEDGGNFEQVSFGQYKNENRHLELPFFKQVFFVDKDRIPSRVRLEISGYGGHGFAYLEVRNSKGVFAPAGINKASEHVLFPANILKKDLQWCYGGFMDTMNTMRHPEAAGIVDYVEVNMRKEKGA